MLRLDMHMIAGVLQYVAVASFAEAWIEKKKYRYKRQSIRVASFAEAWIEKLHPVGVLPEVTSPPSRRRGLKILRHPVPCRPHTVASFAEAWIEKLLDSAGSVVGGMSPPSRRRGLKNYEEIRNHN